MKNIFKQTLIFLTSLCLMCMILACTNNAPSNQNSVSSDFVPNENITAVTTNKDHYTVGVCQLVEHEALDAATNGFVNELKNRLGDKVDIQVKLAQGETNNCALIVNDFVAQNVDLIMANATPALQAAVSGTTDIPILGTSITEYGTALSINNFNGTVGGNVSGTSDLAPLNEQAQMIKDIFPNVQKVGLIFCSSEANSLYQIKVIKEELNKLGIESTEYPFSDSNDLSSVASTAIETQDLIYVPTDNTAAANAGIIDNLARPAKKPVVTGEEGICKICGTVSLTISYNDIGTKTGEMAYQILTNEKNISTMPIEYAPKVTKKYNKEICEELGIEIPNDFVVIE